MNVKFSDFSNRYCVDWMTWLFRESGYHMENNLLTAPSPEYKESQVKTFLIIWT